MIETPSSEPLYPERLKKDKMPDYTTNSINFSRYWLLRELNEFGQGLSVRVEDLTDEVIQLIDAHSEIIYPDALKKLDRAKSIAQTEGITLLAALQEVFEQDELDEKPTLIFRPDRLRVTIIPSLPRSIIPETFLKVPEIPKAPRIPRECEVISEERVLGDEPYNKTRISLRSKILLVAAFGVSLGALSTTERCKELMGYFSESVQQILGNTK